MSERKVYSSVSGCTALFGQVLPEKESSAGAKTERRTLGL